MYSNKELWERIQHNIPILEEENRILRKKDTRKVRAQQAVTSLAAIAGAFGSMYLGAELNDEIMAVSGFIGCLGVGGLVCNELEKKIDKMYSKNLLFYKSARKNYFR